MFLLLILLRLPSQGAAVEQTLGGTAEHSDPARRVSPSAQQLHTALHDRYTESQHNIQPTPVAVTSMVRRQTTSKTAYRPSVVATSHDVAGKSSDFQ